MIDQPLLSILIPSIPSRLAQLGELLTKLQSQIGEQPVEVLALTDNRIRSVGLKRQALLDIATGRYVAFCDDDDDVSDNYIEALCAGCLRNRDIVSFRQRAVINGVEGFIDFSLRNKADESWRAGETVRRRPWHVCAWRAEIAREGIFTDKMFGEDADWTDQVVPLAKSESHIDDCLHTYRYDKDLSAAPPPR